MSESITVIQRKSLNVYFVVGQVWQCRGSGRWEIVAKADDGAWVARPTRMGETAPQGFYQRFADDGRPAGVGDWYDWGAMDLVRLLA